MRADWTPNTSTPESPALPQSCFDNTPHVRKTVNAVDTGRFFVFSAPFFDISH